MNVYFWIMILFGMTIAFAFSPLNPIFGNATDKYTSIDYTNIPARVGTYLSSWNGLLSIGGTILIGAVLGGLNLLVIIPFVLVNFLIDLFVFPTDLIPVGVLPAEIYLLISTFLKLSTYLIIIYFVRGL